MQMESIFNLNKRLFILIFVFLLMIWANPMSSDSLTKDKNIILNLNVNKNKQFTFDLLIGTSMKEMSFMISTLIGQNILISDSCSNCNAKRKFNKETSQSLIQYKQKTILEVIHNLILYKNHLVIYF